MQLLDDVIDFHSHILPTADHGSPSVEVSLRQLALAKGSGVRRIVATSHFYPDRHSMSFFLERRDAAWNLLKGALDPDSPRIALGAEVLICDGIERLSGLDRLCVQGTNVILLELPFSVFKIEYRDSVFRLLKSGFNVVLAHADRYDPDDIELLLECGARVQLNADSLSGLTVPSHLKRWISGGAVVALGSDIHCADRRAYKRFDKAKKRLLKLDSLEYVKASSDSMRIDFNKI